MPVTRPSKVGEPVPRVRPIADWLAHEVAEVDKRLAQLAKAREKAAVVLAQKREQERQQNWDRLVRFLDLSRRQEALLAAVNGKAPLYRDAIEAIYRVKWNRLSKRQRVKHFNRLRTLQHALNRKLAAKKRRLRVSMDDKKLRLVRSKNWKKPHRAIVAGSKGIKRRRFEVPWCAEYLQSLLTGKSKPRGTGHWLPVTTLTAAAESAGFRPSTIKAARKRLGLLCKRTGYGARGEWLVCLPPQKGRKPNK
jgi:hypothetical protein